MNHTVEEIRDAIRVLKETCESTTCLGNGKCPLYYLCQDFRSCPDTWDVNDVDNE